MKKRKFICILSILLIFGMIACAGTQEEKRRQAKAKRTLGEAYMHQGNYTEALKELLEAEKFFPDDHLLHNDLGLTYMAKSRFDEAALHFKKAIDIKPEYAPAKNNLGTMYLAKKEWDMAIACFKQVAGDVLYATPHFPLTNMGIAYFNKLDYQNAEKYYLKALELKPNFVLALRGLGKTYIAMDKLPAAVSIIEKAAKNAPQLAEVYLDLGEAYHLSREYRKALFAYRKAAALSPNSSVEDRAKEEIRKIENLNQQ